MRLDERHDRDEEVEACLVSIKEHLRNYGPREWKLCMDKHPDVSRRHFFRMVRKVNDGIPDQEILASSVKRAKVAAMRVGALPVPISPAIIAADPPKAQANMDFMSRIQELIDDAQMLKNFSVSKDEHTGEIRIKNPMFFRESVKLRRDLIETSLRALRELHDFDKMQTFYNILVEEIAKESPEAARRIMERLQAVNDERGLTIDARVR